MFSLVRSETSVCVMAISKDGHLRRSTQPCYSVNIPSFFLVVCFDLRCCVVICYAFVMLRGGYMSDVVVVPQA